MADSIHAWVDPRELRRMGELLLASPAEETTPLAEDVVYGSEFEGYEKSSAPAQSAPPPQRTHASHSLAEAKRLAEEGGLLRSARMNPTTVAEEPPKPRGGAGPFLGRMTSFGDWLRNEVGVSAFFLLERGGEVLIDENGDSNHIQVALGLLHPSPRVGRQEGGAMLESFRVKLSENQLLEVIPVDSYYGRLVLGLVTAKGLVPSTIEIVAQGLQRAIEPPKPL
jgi:hypothetical protein